MAGYRRRKKKVTTSNGRKYVIICGKGAEYLSGETKLTTGEVAKLTGVNRATLRHYDEKGLLSPERTGEDIANNRRLYDIGDLAQLNTIRTLLDYQFPLDDIGKILKGDEDEVFDLFTKQITESQTHIARQNALLMYSFFIDITDGNFAAVDPIRDLAKVSTTIDNLANIVRKQNSYKETLRKLDALSNEEAQSFLNPLDECFEGGIFHINFFGFTGVKKVVGSFFVWWDSNISDIMQSGYLGFWAIFEDHSLIAKHIESLGKKGDARFLQMYSFFVLLAYFIVETESVVREIAELAQKDILLAVEKVDYFVGLCMILLLGENAFELIDKKSLMNLIHKTIVYMKEVLSDYFLREYLLLSETVRYEVSDLETVERIIDLFDNE